MSDFWVFTLSGAIVSWVPLLIGFVWHSKVMKRYIDRAVTNQNSTIEDITRDQTQDIAHLTEAQTEKLQGRDQSV